MVAADPAARPALRDVAGNEWLLAHAVRAALCPADGGGGAPAAGTAQEDARGDACASGAWYASHDPQSLAHDAQSFALSACRHAETWVDCESDEFSDVVADQHGGPALGSGVVADPGEPMLVGPPWANQRPPGSPSVDLGRPRVGER